MNYPSLIILTGFMGTGKTAVGQALARVIRYSFVDSDREIAAREARSIQQIFETEGESYFRRIEKETITRLAQSPNTVLAVGGGAILDREILDLLSRSGILVLLTATLDEIAGRLGHEDERPLLAKGNRRQKIRKLLKERESVYSQVKIQVDTTGLAIDEVVQKILKKISNG
jgi:shikimate kinase